MPVSFIANDGEKKMNNDSMEENQQTVSVSKDQSVSNQKKPQTQAIEVIVTDMPIRLLA